MSCFEIACKSQGSASLISPLLQGSLFSFFTACYSQHLCACARFENVHKDKQKGWGWVPWTVWTLKLCLNAKIMSSFLISKFPSISISPLPHTYCEIRDRMDLKVHSVFLCCTYVLGDEKLIKGFTKSRPIHCPWRRCDVHTWTIQQGNKIPQVTHTGWHSGSPRETGDTKHTCPFAMAIGSKLKRPQTKVLSYSSIFQEAPFDT